MTFTVLSPFFFVSKFATHPFQPFRRYSLHKTVASADCNILLAATSVSPLFPAMSLQLRALTIFFVSPFVTHFYQRNHQTSIKFNNFFYWLLRSSRRNSRKLYFRFFDSLHRFMWHRCNSDAHHFIFYYHSLPIPTNLTIKRVLFAAAIVSLNYSISPPTILHDMFSHSPPSFALFVFTRTLHFFQTLLVKRTISHLLPVSAHCFGIL